VKQLGLAEKRCALGERGWSGGGGNVTNRHEKRSSGYTNYGRWVGLAGRTKAKRRFGAWQRPCRTGHRSNRRKLGFTKGKSKGRHGLSMREAAYQKNRGD